MLLLLLLGYVLSTYGLHPVLEEKFDVDECRQELQNGIKTIQEMSERLSEYEPSRREKLVDELTSEYLKNRPVDSTNLDGTSQAQCPDPLPTMFPPQSPDSLFPSIFPHRTEQDVFVKYMNAIAEILNQEDAICNGPAFKSFASVTMEQFYGFITIFATNYAQPLCPVCKEVVEAMRQEILKLENNLPPEKLLVARILITHLPSTESLCSMLFPSCYKDLLDWVDEGFIQGASNQSDPYNSTECFKCQFCMTGTMILEPTLVHNLCAELCRTYPPGNSSSPLFPHGVDYKQCMDKADFVYHTGVKVLRKSQFHFCEEYETPNILHCLKAYCMDLQGKFSFLKKICAIIPDHPEEADKYLNIHQKRKRDEI